MKQATPVDFLFTSSTVRSANVRARVQSDTASFPTTLDDNRVRLYCQLSDFVEMQMEAFLDDLYYVGPLREPPRRVYEVSGEMPPDVGVRGERAPEIVFRWPANDNRRSSLQHWLSEFGFAESFETHEVGTGGFSITLTPSGSPVASTFVDTGFGVSQVLPLIVQGLAAPPGSWIITEQPEIHLNPRLQGTLADLFASFASTGVGMLVETHSEHFLLRLRQLVAEGSVDPADVGLYFVEGSDGRSHVREVNIEPTGHILPEEWPADFFQDSLREAIDLAEAQAAAEHRLTEKEKPDDSN